MQANTALLALALMLASTQGQAEQETDLPSDELLDFLSEWQRIDDQWMDPAQLQDISMLEQNKLNGETNEK